VSALHQLYSINEENLALRRQFIGLGDRDIAVLRRLKRWADGAAPKIAREFYDQQFAFSETKAFFERYSKAHGKPIAQLRAGLEKAQAGYLMNIFDEAAAGGTFGTQYSTNSRELERGIGEVTAVAEQTSASSQQVSASTQQTSASTQQIAASAQTLAQTAAQLDLLVSRLKLPA
jgi:hypothetical protein